MTNRKASHSGDLLQRDIVGQAVDHVVASTPKQSRRESSAPGNFKLLNLCGERSDQMQSQQHHRGFAVEEALRRFVRTFLKEQLCKCPGNRVIVIPRWDGL